MTSFDLSYDYRCPFAKNIHLHVLAALEAGADFAVNFVPWTLSQEHHHEGAPDVWDDPAYDQDLLALAVSVAVRDGQAHRFLAAHGALFRARHHHAIRLVTMEEILAVLEPVGVDMDLVRADVASRRPHAVLKENFEAFERYEAFGVPTFVVNHEATFVRYMTEPTSDGNASREVIGALVALMERQPELNEFKHTQVSN